MSDCRIRTTTGRFFDPSEMVPDDVDLIDIAHGLTAICRFNGHLGGGRRFYSVAEHSAHVADQIWRKAGPTVDLVRLALLHDAPEAYIGDMVSPLKSRAEMAYFRELEQHVWACIARQFGLPEALPPVVMETDRFVTEQELLYWGGDRATVDFSKRTAPYRYAKTASRFEAYLAGVLAGE